MDHYKLMQIPLIQYLNIQSNFGKRLNSTIKMRSFSSAEDRLRFYLKENGNKISYHTITDLADILNLKRETLSRLLTKLEKENVIKRSLHTIYLINFGLLNLAELPPR